MKSNRRLFAFVMTFVLVITLVVTEKDQRVDAASKYISVNAFAEALVNELGLDIDELSGTSGYVKKLITIGIMNTGEFTSYTAALRRGDLLMLLNRADNYLYNTNIDAKLIQTVIDKRISDIAKVPESKQDDIARGYIKGFLKGFSNGNYSPDRNLKLTSKILKTDALACLKLLKDKSKRAKISPDGQLLRTTSLPNNAYMFDYILASFPNRY